MSPDLRRARAFYEALGWRRANDDDEVAFYQSGGMVLALWDRAELAADSRVTDGGGWGGVTLAHNVRSPSEVDAVLAEASPRAPPSGVQARRPSGAATLGVFIDPDGHPWEVAHNPGWTIDEDGSNPAAVVRHSPPWSGRPSTGGQGPPVTLTAMGDNAGTGLDRFDFIVIGAGPAGEAAAYKARELGASVAVVERDLFGGSCPHWGCVPSKTLLNGALAPRAWWRLPMVARVATGATTRSTASGSTIRMTAGTSRA